MVQLNDFEIELENKDSSYNHDREIITNALKEAQEEIEQLKHLNTNLSNEVYQLTHEVNQLTRKLNDVDNRLYSLEGRF